MRTVVADNPVAWCASPSVCHSAALCKTAERIEVLFGAETKESRFPLEFDAVFAKLLWLFVIILFRPNSRFGGISSTVEAKNDKGHTLDIAPFLSEGTSPQKLSGMARVLEGFHSFTCTATRLFTYGMNHTCLFLPSRSWSLFTDPVEDGRLSWPRHQHGE